MIRPIELVVLVERLQRVHLAIRTQPWHDAEGKLAEDPYNDALASVAQRMIGDLHEKVIQMNCDRVHAETGGKHP